MTFENEIIQRIRSFPTNQKLTEAAYNFTLESAKEKYVYNFNWLGRPIIQYPQDIVIIQELIFKIKPDLIVETGIAHGGSLILSASIMALNSLCGGPNNPLVIGVDIDIRKHNKIAIEEHPLANYINMIEGSSVDKNVIEEIYKKAEKKKNILVFLDSNHSHDHVFKELKAYAPLVSEESYCVVFDTFVENMPHDLVTDRPWGKGDNPKTAIFEYLEYLKKEKINAIDGNELKFTINEDIDNKLLISCNLGGFLKRNI